MIKIAITGSIASGKSLVEEFLRQQGVITLDTDKIVHELLENNKEIIQKIYEFFSVNGISVNTKSGSIDRKKIGQIVFSDKQKLKELENIIHPEVKRIVEEFFKQNTDKELIAVSVPLLYEAGMEKMFDFVIIVTADEKIRIQRLIKKNFSEEEALKRISTQNFEEEKIKKADFVIENNYSEENTKLKIKNILKRIKSQKKL